MSKMTQAGVDAVASEIVDGLAELLARLHTSRKPVLRRVRHLLEAIYAQEYLGIANSEVPPNRHRFWTLSDIDIVQPILKTVISDSAGESTDEEIKAKFTRYEIKGGDMMARPIKAQVEIMKSGVYPVRITVRAGGDTQRTDCRVSALGEGCRKYAAIPGKWPDTRVADQVGKWLREPLSPASRNLICDAVRFVRTLYC